MKKYFLRLSLLALCTSLLVACQKDEALLVKNPDGAALSRADDRGHLRQTKTFSSEVAIKWMAMQVRQMFFYPPIVGNVAYSRHYAYSGITLYESVVPGMPAYQSIASQLSGLSGLPQTVPGAGYHWAASANAALAHINRKFFPNATDVHKAAMDSLEQALAAGFSDQASADIIERSVQFGRDVAEAVYQWSENDGYKQMNAPYTPPAFMTGGQYWTPPPVLPVHTLQYFGNLRRLVPGSGDGAEAPAPDYANLPAMTSEVINAKPEPGTDNYNKAFWWRDFPGPSTPGHYVSILRQVLYRDQPSLEVSALAYALGGITVMDISISTWQDKFRYLLARPFNYDDVMGQPFVPLLGAPHPEYPAAHASLSVAHAEALTSIFGEEFAFTDSTSHQWVAPYGAWQPRHYDSFRHAGEEAGWSRLYGGIHYRPSIEVGFWQGTVVANNVVAKLQFRK